MNQNLFFFGLTAVLLSLILFGGCSRASKSYAPEVDPDEAGIAALEQYDGNKDGKISGPELDRATPLKANFGQIDTDGDHALAAEEIAERIRFWQTNKQYGGRAPIRCTVLHNRQPLAGAVVKLTPEKFLGGKIKPASGTTGPGGTAVIMTDGAGPDDPPGVGPGFYRVEITKAGQPIPECYNTRTVLGIEASMDNPAMRKRIPFHLKY
ncbi:MAG: hypothetical protein JXB10_07045 [Pirellulales bacterium]|nr:hypothetical protein [Pirellulales bacterium]